jgi:copper transporter 1
MIFTWDYRNLCIIFNWWHIRSFSSLLISLLAIVALTAGYEAVRAAASAYEARDASAVSSAQQRERGDDGGMYTFSFPFPICAGMADGVRC